VVSETTKGRSNEQLLNRNASADTLQRLARLKRLVRRANAQLLISEEILAALLTHSPFVPADLLMTFSRGFARFFQGDFISAINILTPLLENSLRHLLKSHAHEVSKLDSTTGTQQDMTILNLFVQMRPQMEAIFTRPLVADIAHVFLKKPGHSLRHAVAHGLLPAVLRSSVCVQKEISKRARNRCSVMGAGPRSEPHKPPNGT
jgi:hypothetical protein